MNRNRSTTYRCVVFHSQNTKRGSLGWPPLPHPQFKIGPWKKEQIMVPTFVLFHNKPNLFIAFGHHLLCYINYYFNAFETLFFDNYQKWLQLFLNIFNLYIPWLRRFSLDWVILKLFLLATLPNAALWTDESHE